MNENESIMNENENIMNVYRPKPKPHCPDVCGNESCNETFIEEKIDVCVPVSVEPCVDVGRPMVSVVGRPCVEEICCPPLNQKGICKFAVSQKICVKVPITFFATAKANSGLSTDCCDDHHHREYADCYEGM